MKNQQDSEAKEFIRLVQIIKKLRDPETGCPWDKEQNHQTLKPYLIEESYEVLDAIDSGDPEVLCEELGDVLLQVVLHAQVASDSGAKAFNVNSVCEVLSEKLIRRHPHIFGDINVKDSSEVKSNWEKIKQTEKKAGESESTKSILDGVPKQLPGLLKAQRLGEKSARVGFDWQEADSIKEKVMEELIELEAETAGSEKQAEEFGDLIFSLVQWARRQNIDAEAAMQKTCRKFTDRFKNMEQQAGESFAELSLEQKEALWQASKAACAQAK